MIDDDPFIQHNAFRSPGSFSREELEGGQIKSTFHADRYTSMRKGIVDACGFCRSAPYFLRGLGTLPDIQAWRIAAASVIIDRNPGAVLATRARRLHVDSNGAEMDGVEYRRKSGCNVVTLTRDTVGEGGP